MTGMAHFKSKRKYNYYIGIEKEQRMSPHPLLLTQSVNNFKFKSQLQIYEKKGNKLPPGQEVFTENDFDDEIYRGIDMFDFYAIVCQCFCSAVIYPDGECNL